MICGNLTENDKLFLEYMKKYQPDRYKHYKFLLDIEASRQKQKGYRYVLH